jgi:hypothetical protein
MEIFCCGPRSAPAALRERRRSGSLLPDFYRQTARRPQLLR